MDGRQDKDIVLPPSLADHTADSFHLLVNVVKDYAIFSLDLAGMVVSWNAGAERLTGYTSAEVIGQSYGRFFPAADIASGKPQQQLAHAIGSGEWVEEGQWVRKDGTVFWATLTLTPLRDQAGTHIGFAQVLHDLTERQQAAALLQERLALQQLLSTVLATAPGVVHAFQKRLDGSVCFPYASPAITNIFGCHPEDLAEDASFMFAMIHPHDVERIKTTTDASAQALSLWHEEFRIQHPQRGELWVEGRTMPTREPDGSTLWYGFLHDISERKHTEETLRQSAQRLRDLADAIPQIVWMSDADGWPDYRNREGQRVMGSWSAANWLVPFHPEERQSVAEAWKHAIHSGEPYEIELRIWDLTREEYRWYLARAVPVRDHGGHIAHWYGTATDIHAQKTAETALRRASALLQGVVENTTDAVFVKDRDGRYLLFNQAASQFVGVPVAQVLGKDDTALFDPAGAQSLIERDQRIMRSGEAETAEELLTAAGVTRTYLATKAPYRNAQGEIIGVIGISRDITARKQAEEALRDSQARLRAAMEGGRICTWVWDIPQHLLSWDDSAAALFGWSPEQSADGRLETFLSYIHPEDLPYVEAERTKALAGRQSQSVEFRFLRQDGVTLRIVARGSVEYDVSGQPVRMIGTCLDITEHVRLEEQFRQAQKMEAIGQLAGGVAHDFNNILTVILGLSDVLLEALAHDYRMHGYVMDIRKAGERAATLTRQLLAFSRRQVLAPRILDLNTIVSGIEMMLQRLIGEDITLLTTLQPALPSVKVDPGQMEQVIINLAVNARDAMPQGGHLTIATQAVAFNIDDCLAHPDLRPGAYVRLMVTDTGSGMSAEVKAHLFEPFFTTKEQGKGTGLGLSTVFGIVKQSEGYIEVDSDVGAGTCFTMYFPTVAPSVPTAEPDSSPEAIALGSETILLAEDDAVVRHIMKMSLEAYGYTVLEASNGQQALALAARATGPIHLLITDVVMPEMGGRQLVTLLQVHYPALPVLFMSGYTDDAMLRQGGVDAMGTFLQKPFAPVTLLRTVRQVLDEAT